MRCWANRTKPTIVARRGLWLLVSTLMILAACDPVETEPTASTGPVSDVGGSAAGVIEPTRTIKPILSFTPRFTATPLPSATFTPSITPEPTETPVPPTLTATLPVTPPPTVSGIVQSNQSRVNLRSAPGFNSDIVLSIPANSSLGEIGRQKDDQGLDWYKVVYVDEDGEEYRLWIRSNLVATDYDEIVRVQPTNTVTPGSQVTTGATIVTRTPGATPVPERVDILAYCRQKNVIPPSPTTNDTVYVEWSWFVAREEQMQQHLDNANYEVRLDGKLLENWASYGTELKRESGVYIIYWYYPVGKLSAGDHEITFRLTWDTAITDGYANFGPGTANEADTGNCLFTVREP